jgi:hypothetical protein
MSSHNDSFVASGSSPTRSDFICENHGSIFNRQSYEKFYNQLALLSGGSIALSVTYLGYLKTVTNHPLIHTN